MASAPLAAAIVVDWLARPWHLAVVLGALLGVVLTLRWERGRADRYEPFALVALGLAAIGHSASIAGARAYSLRLERGPPLDILRTGQVTLVGAVACGLVALTLLHVKHLKRRGRIYASCALCTSACTAWIVQYFLIAIPPPFVHRDDFELARVVDAQPWYPASDERDPHRIARVGADGSFEIGAVTLPPAAPAAALVAELARLAAGMPRKDGDPDGALWVMVDRRAPFAALAALTAAAADPAVRIWRLPLAVERTSVAFEPMAYGTLAHYHPRGPDGALDEYVAGAPEEERIEARVGAPDAPVFSLGGAPCADAAELGRRMQADDQGIFLLLAAPELRWADLEPVLAAVGSTRSTLGAVTVLTPE